MKDKTLSNVKQSVASRKSNVLPINPEIEPVEIEVEKISNVQHKAIEWLWKDVLAYGKMTLFAGEPGVGKSQLLLYIASVLSHGYAFHYQKELVPQSNVLLISGEDNADDTIKPRLLALNANLERIDYVKGIKKLDRQGRPYYDPICLIENLESLEDIIVKHQYRLVIVDPIALYLGKVDENKNKEIRSALSHLQVVSERHRFCLILNSHFSKPSNNANKTAINRIMGSIGFAAAARIVYGIIKDPENPERRLFLPIKNNIGQDSDGFVYNIKSVRIENHIETSRINWLDERVQQTANEALNSVGEKSSPKTDMVKQKLANMLGNETKYLANIRNYFVPEICSYHTLLAAKEALKIIETESLGYKKGKMWTMPST